MKPFIKWQGGKRRELPHIREFIPDGIPIIAEPFCGGTAVAFDNEGIAILNDTNARLINLYSVAADKQMFETLFNSMTNTANFYAVCPDVGRVHVSFNGCKFSSWFK